MTYTTSNWEQDLESREATNNTGTNQATSSDRISPFTDFEKNIR